MRASIILKTTNSKIIRPYALAWWYIFTYNSWNGTIRDKCIVKGVPIEKLKSLIKDVENCPDSWTIIFTITYRKWLSEIERIEAMFKNTF